MRVLFYVLVFMLSSCTAGITIGKANRIEQSVTNAVDSTTTTFSIIPNLNK